MGKGGRERGEEVVKGFVEGEVLKSAEMRGDNGGGE